ncbi:SagB family peptide dehydrogenase [Amycolatopsis samaneae]|uniref:SagB family peptide dehydrogenase n=1 Tax=Amycolatopsis samaneae TaxID=664691 RepID=A0ABW5GPM3_9PSEU
MTDSTDSTAAPAGFGERYALRGGVSSVRLSDGRTSLFCDRYAETLGVLGEADLAILTALSDRPYTPAELAEIAGPGAGWLLRALREGGWLVLTVTRDGTDLYRMQPLRPPPSPPPGDDGGEPRLSRFAVLRAGGTGMVAESPLAWCDVEVLDPAVLAEIGGYAGRAGGSAFPDELRARVRRDLRWAGLLVDAGAEEDLRSRQWSPHELWFHTRSTRDERAHLGEGFAGTHWAKGVHDPLPARPEPYPGPAVALPEPDTERMADPGLTAVLARRRSVREHDNERPLTAARLGEFLHRGVRVTGETELDGIGYARRPYPSGGGAHELELYPIVSTVDGVAPGMYHYDAHEHVLRPVSPIGAPPVRRLLRHVRRATGEPPTEPQVVFVVAARVGRVMWKYERMAYALTLKHVGVLYQTLYCVATAMELAPCGLGTAEPAAFAEASGRDPLIETMVGGFLLGTRR